MRDLEQSSKVGEDLQGLERLHKILLGPGERIRWGVWQTPAFACPEGTRRNSLIAHGHDDLLLSASLCTILDQQEWAETGTAEIVHRTDPLEEIDQADW